MRSVIEITLEAVDLKKEADIMQSEFIRVLECDDDEGLKMTKMAAINDRLEKISNRLVELIKEAKELRERRRGGF